MNDVYSRIKEQENLSFRECSLTTFYRLMKQMAKVGDISRKILMEKNDVVIKRRAYLLKKGTNSKEIFTLFMGIPRRNFCTQKSRY